MKFKSIFLAVALLSACAGSAQITKQGGAYLFRMKFVKGAKLSYSLVNTATMPPGMGAQGDMKMTSPMTMTVKAVEKGIATIDYSVGPMLVNGKSSGAKPVTGTIKQDARGQVVGGEDKTQGVASMSFPEKPIKIGDSWTSETTSPGMGSQLKMKSTFTLTGFKTVSGKEMAVLGVKMSSSQGMKVSGSGTMLVLMSDCSLFKGDIKTQVVMGERATINAATLITRK